MLAGLRSDGNILPVPSLKITKLTVAGGDLAIVEVAPSALPPVRYKGRVYVRVGPRKGIANEGDERALSERRTSRARTFDAQPCRGAAVTDLVLDLFKVGYLPKALAAEVLAENHRTAIEQLASLRFYDIESQLPTNAGILLFGRDPLAFFPVAYLQQVRFAGSAHGSDVVSEQRAAGDLIGILREVDWLVNHAVTSRPVPVTVLQERQNEITRRWRSASF